MLQIASLGRQDESEIEDTRRPALRDQNESVEINPGADGVAQHLAEKRTGLRIRIAQQPACRSVFENILASETK